MMAEAITFDLGGFPPIEFQLASSEGLAPLPLPQSLPQPSPDAVRLFQAAMERDEGEVMRGAAETQRTVGGDVFQTGLTGLTGFERVEAVPVETIQPSRAGEISRGGAEVQRTVDVVTKPVYSPFGVETAPRPENPVNPVNPVQKEFSATLNPVSEEMPVLTPAPQDLRVSAPLREATKDRVDAAPVETVQPSRAGENSRRDAESQRAVGGEVFQTGLTGFEKTVEPSEAPRAGEVVTKPAFAPLGVDQTPHSENPVNLVNPAQKGLPTELNPVKEEAPVQVTQDLRASAPLREINKDIADAPVAPAALPSAAQPTPLAAASEFPEVQQVVAAQSARTEAVVATVTRMVATVARMVETVNQIVEAVAAEIAVSPTLASGNGDIRITLKPTVLDGSEIRLTAQSGELTVSIAPATPAAAALAAAALPRLETALAEHAPSFHHVAVVVATARKGKEK